MPRVKGNTDAASTFLRAFRKSPAGPPPHKWPAPSVLRRWLRRPAFRAALRSIQQTLRLQSDFHLTTAATLAAAKLDPKDDGLTPQHLDKLTQLLRLSHLRQRFPTDSPSSDSPDPADEFDALAKAEKPITRLDVFFNLHLVDPNQRLTPEELRKVASKNGYPMPLLELPDFPRPPDDPNNFYYNLIKSPGALLWFMKLYDESGNDHRFQPILLNCGILMPHSGDPNRPLPRFRHIPAKCEAIAPSPEFLATKPTRE